MLQKKEKEEKEEEEEDEEKKRKRKEEEEKINQHKGLENISNEIINETSCKGKKVPVNLPEASKIPNRLGNVPLPCNNQNT